LNETDACKGWAMVSGCVRVSPIGRVLSSRLNSLWLLCLLIPVSFSSCVTAEQSDGPGRVVSKSSYIRPSWVGKSIYFEPLAKLGYSSYRKDRVRILDLGIKQAQIEAAAQVVARFDEAFANFVVDLVKRDNPKIPASDGASSQTWYDELRSLALTASRQFQAPVVSAESVYWEEVEIIEGNSPGSGSGSLESGEAAQELIHEFRIYVQMSFDRGEITDRLSVLTQKLEADHVGQAVNSGKFASAIAVLDTEFPELRRAAVESKDDKKEVESIQTEMDSAGSTVESSVEQQGPRGRKFEPNPSATPGAAAPKLEPGTEPQAKPGAVKSPAPPAKKKSK